MPKGKMVKALRSDSAAYQTEIINHCEGNDIEFAIGADLDEKILGAIRSISEEDWRPYQILAQDLQLALGKYYC